MNGWMCFGSNSVLSLFDVLSKFSGQFFKTGSRGRVTASAGGGQQLPAQLEYNMHYKTERK